MRRNGRSKSGDQNESSDDDEQGFQEFGIQIQSKDIQQHSKYPVKLRDILPEANPVMKQSSRPTDFQPRILIQNIEFYKTPLVLQKIKECRVYQENIEEEGGSDPDQLNNTTSPVLKHTMSLYNRYILSKNFKRIYSKYNNDQKGDDPSINFAGFYINLSYLVDFGKSMFTIGKTFNPNQNSDYLSTPLNSSITSILNDDDLIFDSNFECGNLFSVFQVGENDYHLILQNDINSKGYTQWFFFSVRNLQEKRTVNFTIANMAKIQSQFQDGMKPAIFSMRKFNESGVKWYRAGSNFVFKKSQNLKVYSFQTLTQIVISINQDNLEEAQGCYSSLSFSLKFDYKDDLVYIASSIPYSYSEMINFVKSIQSRETYNKPKINFKKQILCYTISNNAVLLLTITSEHEQYKNERKKIALIIGRQHPGETVGSFQIEGVIDFLMGDSLEAQYLRDKFIFKIIPMVNPDGVVYGNTRCNLAGVDLNRQYIEPNQLLHESPYAIINLIDSLKKQNYKLEWFIDIHGHSKKLNSFIYACNDENNPIMCKLYPMILSQLDSQFNYDDCTYGIQWYQEATARAVIFQMIDSSHAYTVESSMFGYFDKEKGSAVHFEPQDLHSLGQDLMKGIYIYQNFETQNLIVNTKQNLEAEIKEKNLLADQEPGKKDSGSDSDPLADELNIKEQLNSFMPQKVAQKLGVLSTNKSKSQLGEQNTNMFSVTMNINYNNNKINDNLRQNSQNKQEVALIPIKNFPLQYVQNSDRVDTNSPRASEKKNNFSIIVDLTKNYDSLLTNNEFGPQTNSITVQSQNPKVVLQNNHLTSPSQIVKTSESPEQKKKREKVNVLCNPKTLSLYVNNENNQIKLETVLNDKQNQQQQIQQQRQWESQNGNDSRRDILDEKSLQKSYEDEILKKFSEENNFHTDTNDSNNQQINNSANNTNNTLISFQVNKKSNVRPQESKTISFQDHLENQILLPARTQNLNTSQLTVKRFMSSSNQQNTQYDTQSSNGNININNLNNQNNNLRSVFEENYQNVAKEVINSNKGLAEIIKLNKSLNSESNREAYSLSNFSTNPSEVDQNIIPKTQIEMIDAVQVTNSVLGGAGYSTYIGSSNLNPYKNVEVISRKPRNESGFQEAAETLDSSVPQRFNNHSAKTRSDSLNEYMEQLPPNPNLRLSNLNTELADSKCNFQINPTLVTSSSQDNYGQIVNSYNSENANSNYRNLGTNYDKQLNILNANNNFYGNSNQQSLDNNSILNNQLYSNNNGMVTTNQTQYSGFSVGNNNLTSRINKPGNLSQISNDKHKNNTYNYDQKALNLSRIQNTIYFNNNNSNLHQLYLPSEKMVTSYGENIQIRTNFHRSEVGKVDSVRNFSEQYNRSLKSQNVGELIKNEEIIETIKKNTTDVAESKTHNIINSDENIVFDERRRQTEVVDEISKIWRKNQDRYAFELQMLYMNQREHLEPVPATQLPIHNNQKPSYLETRKGLNNMVQGINLREAEIQKQSQNYQTLIHKISSQSFNDDKIIFNLNQQQK